MMSEHPYTCLSYGELVHMANWHIWRSGIWLTDSYGKSTKANQHMANWNMAKQHHILFSVFFQLHFKCSIVTIMLCLIKYVN